MAKKKTVSQDTSAIPTAPATPRAPARRRAPAKKTGNGKTAVQPTQAQIAEAAYFRHLNRGGGNGDEFNDWIEAERDLKERRR